MDLWRISNHLDLAGLGGRRFSARWHTAGQPIVYLAESPAGAMLEILVHLDLLEQYQPRTYTLLHVTAPDTFVIPSLRTPSGEKWKTDESITRKLGDSWLKSHRSAVARVPSVILPQTFNYLLNPLHSDAARIKIKSYRKFPLDSRLASQPNG
jgi:RES domain-containing protein